MALPSSCPNLDDELSDTPSKHLVDELCRRGAVAQLGERRVRNAKVWSSILLGSTN